jgi:putative membrane protein
MMYGWHQQGWGPGVWIAMVVGMILFWSLVVFGIVVLVRYFGAQQSKTEGSPDEAERELRTRFARGEIDEDEFKRRLSILRGET